MIPRYSIISGIAKALDRPPVARTISNAAAFACKEFKCSTASWYVLVDIDLKRLDEYRFRCPETRRCLIDLGQFHCISYRQLKARSHDLQSIIRIKIYVTNSADATRLI